MVMLTTLIAYCMQLGYAPNLFFDSPSIRLGIVKTKISQNLLGLRRLGKCEYQELRPASLVGS